MNKNGHGLWNFLVVLTVVVCLLAFVLHSKNWMKVDDQGLKIISGFYYQNVKFSELDSVVLLDKIPPMERLNGFSAFEKEKGIFILHYYGISIWPKSQTILELEKADQSKEIKNGLLLVGFFFDKGRSR